MSNPADARREGIGEVIRYILEAHAPENIDEAVLETLVRRAVGEAHHSKARDATAFFLDNLGDRIEHAVMDLAHDAFATAPGEPPPAFDGESEDAHYERWIIHLGETLIGETSLRITAGLHDQLDRYFDLRLRRGSPHITDDQRMRHVRAYTRAAENLLIGYAPSMLRTTAWVLSKQVTDLAPHRAERKAGGALGKIKNPKPTAADLNRLVQKLFRRHIEQVQPDLRGRGRLPGGGTYESKEELDQAIDVGLKALKAEEGSTSQLALLVWWRTNGFKAFANSPSLKRALKRFAINWTEKLDQHSLEVHRGRKRRNVK
jgi:hypothetical protein